MGNCFRKYYDWLNEIRKKGKTGNLEEDYFFLKRKNIENYYKEIMDIDYNINIALQKKYFDKVVTITSQSLSLSHNLEANWKEYIIDYFDCKALEGNLWYYKVKNEVENGNFIFENQFASMMFYSGIEAKFKPLILNDCEKVTEKDVEEEELNDKILMKKL